MAIPAGDMISYDQSYPSTHKRNRKMRIKEATQSQERNDASILFAEYYTSVGFDSPSCVSRLLCDIERSGGRIFLAYTGEVAVAVASYVYTEPSVAELRGLYVRPRFRSKGWGGGFA